MNIFMRHMRQTFQELKLYKNKEGKQRGLDFQVQTVQSLGLNNMKTCKYLQIIYTSVFKNTYFIAPELDYEFDIFYSFRFCFFQCSVLELIEAS